MVREIAPEWTRHANLDFEFTDDPRAEIRVTFDANDGAWSYVGTDNSSIPLHAATLNLGWQDEGVILHEFGHMIGLAHEHQNPDGGIVWNEAEVIRDLSGPPNFWDEATIRHNVLNKYSVDQVHGTDFDDTVGHALRLPRRLDRQHRRHRREQRACPHLDRDLHRQREDVSRPRRPGSSRRFRMLEVVHPAAHRDRRGRRGGRLPLLGRGAQGRHVVETSGSTDVVIVLFGPDNQNLKIAEDDDGGEGRNARIAADLGPGEYYRRRPPLNPTERAAPTGSW